MEVDTEFFPPNLSQCFCARPNAFKAFNDLNSIFAKHFPKYVLIIAETNFNKIRKS